MSPLPRYLDCTLRDGGYINNWAFSLPFAKALYRAASRAGVTYLEAGFIDPTAKPGNPWTHLTLDTLRSLRAETPGGSRIAAMINYGSATVEQIPERGEGGADLLRVACHKKDAPEATRFAAALRRKGYKTTVNYMGISNYSNCEILRLIDLMNTYAGEVDYFYVADSFGSLLPRRTREIFNTLRFGTAAKLGFHPHNNLQLAFANTLEAMEAGIDIVDGSVFGMGRGAGNLYTDAVIAYYEQLQPDTYRVEPILQFADLHMSRLRENWEWGYSLPQLLSGLLKCHPNYPTNLLREKSYTADAIFQMLKSLPTEERGKLVKGRVESLKRDYLIHRARNLVDHHAEALHELKERHNGKVLIVCGGPSVEREASLIRDFIERENPLVVTVNSARFAQPPQAVFFGNLRRWLQRGHELPEGSLVLLGMEIEKDLVEGHPRTAQIRPSSAVLGALGGEPFLPTNSGIEAALPLLSAGFSSLTYCGLDGFASGENYFYEEPDPVTAEDEINKVNEILRREWLQLLAVSKNLGTSVKRLTQSIIDFEK